MLIQVIFCKVFNMKKTIIFFFINSILLCQNSFESIDIIYDARSLGLSGVGISDNITDESEYNNPSLLKIKNKKIKLSFLQYPANIKSHFIKYSTGFRNFSLSATYKSVNFGDFQRYDNEGIDLGQYSARDNSFGISISNSFSKSSDIGISLSLFQSRIDNLNSILGLLTLGANVDFPDSKASLGVVIRNIGLIFNDFTNYKETIPTSVGIGISKKITYLPLIIYSDIIWWELRTIARFGGEFSINNNFLVQIGTTSNKNQFNTNLLWRNIFSGISSGFIYKFSNNSIGMSVSNHGIAGILIGISFSTNLN